MDAEGTTGVSDSCSASRLTIAQYMPGIRLTQGGAVRAVLDWCAVFAERGHRMILLTYEGDDVPPDWFDGKPGKPQAFLLPAPRGPGRQLGWRALRTADELIARADVLHLHGPWLIGNRQLAKLARRRDVPYIVSVHGMLDDWSMDQRRLRKRLYLRLIGRDFLDGAAYVHCTAKAEESQAAKWFTNQRTTVLPYLVDLTPFHSLPGPEAGLSLLPPETRQDAILLFLGRLHEKKGIDVLIRAAGRLRTAGTSFVLLIAGKGEPIYERYLRDLTAQLGLNDRVVFLGHVAGQTKLSLYQAADIFVLPTMQENFGLVLVEALACGTPIVTTMGVDIWCELERAGGVITRATPESIVAAIGDLLARPHDLRTLGAHGRKWVLDAFATGPLAKRYEALYHRAIEQQFSSSHLRSRHTHDRLHKRRISP